MKLMLLAAASAAALLSACSPDQPAKTAAAGPPKPAFGSFGIDTAQMDKNVKAGDDFFKYANGAWLATFKMPDDKIRFGAFDQLRDKSDDDVHALVDTLAKTPPAAGSAQEKVLNLYKSWIDEAGIEAVGAAPLKGDLDAIAAAKTKADLIKLMGRFDYTSPVALYIQPDPADTAKYVVSLTQSGLGMPSKDHYLLKDPTYEGYRTAYKAYIQTILELTGEKNAAKNAAAVFNIEMKLASVHWTAEDQRVTIKTNNPMDRAGLKKLAPAMDWDAFLATRGLSKVQHVVVNETSAIANGVKLLDSVPVPDWKEYLAFHLASDYASFLPKAFDEAEFNFFNKTLNGQQKQRDRWKRGVALLNNTIGEGVGELYVAKQFPPGTKAKADALVANLKTAMGERLKTLSWMDDATRAEAMKKLSTFEPRIGYPVAWRDYSALAIQPGKLFENVRAANKFEWDRQVNRLDKPVDRTEWNMNPQTVNAYYNPLYNQITFPAAILQPPFFDPNADPAVNYGAIGAVIGHEMGHGFDDQGKDYDETGKIRDWWTTATKQKFEAAAKKFGAQYAAFCPLPASPADCIKPDRTMGENIGDLGGLEMAYTAYHLSLNGQEAPTIDGFSGDQRFFLGHAQIWRGAIRDDALRTQLLSDPHSPAAARASIPEKNIDAWYSAFSVKEGDKSFLKPEDRVHIW